MREFILYNGDTAEPYIDIEGNDLWCNAEDFRREDRWKVRFMVDAANAVIAAALASPAEAPKLVPVGSISKAHLKAIPEPWCKEVLLYSPNNQGDYPKGRVQLFTIATTGEQA